MLLVFIALVAVLILVWMHRFEGVLALYHDGDGGDPHCIYLDNGAIRLEIIRRRAAWNFRVTPLRHPPWDVQCAKHNGCRPK